MGAVGCGGSVVYSPTASSCCRSAVFLRATLKLMHMNKMTDKTGWYVFEAMFCTDNSAILGMGPQLRGLDLRHRLPLLRDLIASGYTHSIATPKLLESHGFASLRHLLLQTACVVRFGTRGKDRMADESPCGMIVVR